MPFFAYKARNARGELVEGVLKGIDSGGVANQLVSTGITPVQINATSNPNGDGAKRFWNQIFADKVRPIDVQLFSRQLYTLLKSGVPIMRGLTGLQESAINKAFAKLIQDLRESLDAGRELSSAMRRYPNAFSAFYISMVRVGELTGNLENIFLRLYGHLEFEREMRERVKTALRYPMFVVATMVIAMVVINIWVIPAFAKVFKGFNAELPFMTRILIGISDFFVNYWYVLAALLVAAIVAMRIFIASPPGRLVWDRLKLQLPIVGRIVLKATLARFARSFALSSKSGVPIVQALNVVAQTVDNTFIASRIEHMRDGVERGESIYRCAVGAKVFTPVVLQMVAVGEESGAIDDLMDEIALMYEHEVEYELKTLSSNIEPILIVILGAMVLVLALGIFLPIWDLGKVALRR
ncbi:MAG: type II secretion system F family protein [Burkholderiaceae bacterium]|nr:type II secretion system F family protein [Burkholderiaceae bacterium]